MDTKNISSEIKDWNSQDYVKLIDHYEQLINDDDTKLKNYFYLGLAHLLKGDEENAQTTWLFSLAQIEQSELLKANSELVDILEDAASFRLGVISPELAWSVRQYIREFNPLVSKNIFELIKLSCELKLFDDCCIEEWAFTQLLTDDFCNTIEHQDFLNFIELLVIEKSNKVKEILEIYLDRCSHLQEFLPKFFFLVLKIGDELESPQLAAELIEIGQKHDPKSLIWIRHLARFLTNSHCFSKALAASKKYYDASIETSDKFLSNYQILRTLMYAGKWLDVLPVAEHHKELLDKLISQPSSSLSVELAHSLIASTGFLAYLQDELVENYAFRTLVAQAFKNSLAIQSSRVPNILRSREKIKVGYIAHTLRTHSVGWLSRWIFQYHNQNEFEIYIYFVNKNLIDEFYVSWFRDIIPNCRELGIDAEEIVEQIEKDEIDILVDLDSISLNVTFEVMARKAAPIQLSWLGWDAPGLDTIDYFIADSHVLPASADDLYLEKPWRLNGPYIAVDGFEVGIQTLSLSSLNLPSDALVYFSAQVGAKRHPSTVRLQLQILKEVSNSFFLIKGVSDKVVIEDFFFSLAEEIGVEKERIVFLPHDPNEYVHRANLAIADVVLDTYPYNGATTSLEVLWMGIPLVTRVGNTFSSRNSYTFMRHVGVEEGIAWNDEEYVDWGIRLGTDKVLRQQVSWKLRQSRRNSDLWNAQKFTRSLEKAYQDIWSIYRNESSGK